MINFARTGCADETARHAQVARADAIFFICNNE